MLRSVQQEIILPSRIVPTKTQKTKMYMNTAQSKSIFVCWNGNGNVVAVGPAWRAISTASIADYARLARLARLVGNEGGATCAPSLV